MQIFIRLFTGKHITLDVNPTDLVEDIKSIIFEREKIPIEHQHITFSGKLLEDKNNLEFYNVQKDSTFHLIARGLNGTCCLRNKNPQPE